MVPSGPPTPVGGAQPLPPSLLRSNSGMLGGQGSPMPSLMSPRPHYNNVNLLGNVPNVSSLLNQSFGNGVMNPGITGTNDQRGGMDTGAEPDPLSGVGMGFNPSSSSFVPTNMANVVSSSQVQGQQFSDQSGNRMLTDQQPSHSQQREAQNFQHPLQPMQQFSAPSSNQPQQQQQQFQSIRGGLGGIGSVKLESQLNNDQHASQQQQQIQSLRGLDPVKMEPQQLHPMRSQPHVKIEPQHPDQSILLQQQQLQHRQQLLQMSRQSSQAAAAAQLSLLQQHRLLQLQPQQPQQHQILKSLPQQRSQLQQQFQAQSLPMRSPVKPVYEVGACARRLTQYMHQQQNRPEDNNIEFWRRFVAEFFAPNSKKKWCVSMYGSGRQTTGVFPQDAWHCEICNRKPGRGFEATVEVLPRLFKIKYESGTLEELLYVDMPREYHNPSGQIVLDYAKAIQESVFEQLRVVRDGQLRIVFSPDLKICSWEFCARRHEELIPRRLLIPQVSQLGAAAQKYQAATQNASSNSSVSDLQSNCNMFVASARQFAKALEVPLVNDLGYTKRYVRCLQISEVVNSMKDLIDYSRITGTGPMESLAKFPRRTNASSGFQTQNQPSEDHQQQQLQQQQPSQNLQKQQQPPPQQQQQQQQLMMQNSNNEQASSSQAAGVQLAQSNGLASVNNTHNTASTSVSASTITGHHNSMVSRPPNPMSSASSPYATTSMPSPGSSNTMQPPPPSQSNPSPFQSPTPPPSSGSPLQPPSNNALSNTTNSPANMPMQQQQQQQQQQHSALLSDGDADSQSSVQKFIQEMMLSNQLNGPGGMGVSSLGNDVKNVNDILPLNNSSLNGPNCHLGNGLANSNPGFGFGGMGQAAMLNGVRASMGNNPIAMNGRVGMTQIGRDQGVSHHQQQDLSNQLLNGFGSVNGNNLQFDWKPSP